MIGTLLQQHSPSVSALFIILKEEKGQIFISEDTSRHMVFTDGVLVGGGGQ